MDQKSLALADEGAKASLRADQQRPCRLCRCGRYLPGVFTTRPELRGTFGMVASTHWLASAAGMAVLEQGGNAFDAAVAAGFTLQVVEPHLNGPGGDLPAILWPASRGEPLVLCAQGTAPRAATIERYRDDLGLELVPGTGPLAAVVPGAFGGWIALLRDSRDDGARRRPPLRDRLRGERLSDAPADRAARSATSSRSSATSGRRRRRSICRRSSRSRCTATRSSPQTYRRLAAADDPLAEWYDGFVAEAIVDFQEREWMDSSGVRHRGLLAEDDLRDWRATLRGAARRRLPRTLGAQGRPMEPGTRVPPAAAAARRLRPRGDGPCERRVRPHGDRVREARVRRPRGVVRRPRLRRRADGPAALARVRGRAPQARRRRGLGGAASGRRRSAPACARRRRRDARPASASRRAATPSTSTSSTAGGT